MNTFAAIKPVSTTDATTYALVIMKIMLQFGFCHTCILDNDSKFYGVGRKALDLLKFISHVLSGGNHNLMIIERLNCYLNVEGRYGTSRPGVPLETYGCSYGIKS
jgi:hypothetical protein